jgi:hypothetical protein
MFFLAMFSLVIILGAIVVLARLPFMQIRNVAVDGTTIASQEEISNVALSALEGSYFNLIPQRSILFFPKQKIHRAVQSSFKEIQDFKIKRKNLTTVSLSLAERVPVAIVCSGFRDDSNDEKCFWSDRHGYIMSSIASSSTAFSEKAYSYFYVPETQGEVKPGKNFLSEKRFKELLQFIENASRGGLSPLGMLIGENGEYEMYIRNRDGKSEATVSFDERSPFEITISNLLAFWQNGGKTGQASSTASYDYINLRFGNTVYYSPR